MFNEQPFSGWQGFASYNNLTFQSGLWLIRNPSVSGNYGVYHLKLETFTRRKEASKIDSTYTQMTLWVNKSVNTSLPQKKLVSSQEFDMNKMLNLLISVEAQQTIKGQFYAYESGHEIRYEREGIIDDRLYLQVVLDSLKQIIEVYPQVVELGGEGVSGLLPIAKRFHPLQHIASQLLWDIGKDTKKHLKQKTSDLLCSYCLVHCGPHQLTTPWTGPLTYYGCKVCSQSREFITAEIYRLVMILDNALEVERSQHNTTIRVNWMISQRLFDFDEVEIIRATDEEIEHFAVQVGNDTDEVRKSRYMIMTCKIFPQSQLSENTKRILQHLFGQVEIINNSQEVHTGTVEMGDLGGSQKDC